jgi:anhydro-N-acetylmuramic acid kinase
MKIAGAISGTSLDGIDVAICNVVAHDGRIAASCDRFATIPFDDGLRDQILAAYPPARINALDVSALHAAVGEAFGNAIRTVAAGARLDAVASHGLTLAHDGDAHHTLQIGDPFRIRERVRATVVYDFRSADTAAGGTGAPLVPFVDAILFAAYAPCVALNLGGIANMTVLPQCIAFDSGPSNLLIDSYVTLRSDGEQRYDRDGKLARRGSPNVALLARMLDDPYFTALLPKTTGRERYGVAWVEQHRADLDRLTFEDAVATLTALTVRTVADALRSAAPDATRLIISGGGARNPALVDSLRISLAGVEVTISDELGVNADAKEAIAFAVLGYCALTNRPAGMPSVTGASGPRILGAIAPFELASLLDRMAIGESTNDGIE